MVKALVVAIAVVALFGATTKAALLPSTGTLILPVNQAFNCDRYQQPINFDKVKVVLNASYTGVIDDAFNLNHGDCHGRIGRVECDTWIGDCVKVGSTAHNLVIASGYLYCHAKKPLKHQDGVQALGGTHVHFQNLSTYCPTANNASFFVTGGTDITCQNCNLDGGAQTVSISGGTGNGVFDSLVHTGKFTAFRVQSTAINPINRNNVILPCDVNCP